MDFEILIYLALLAAFGYKSAGKLITKPSDTDVKVNHSTYFNCSTDYGSTANFWFHATKLVYTGNAILQPYHERFEIDRNVWNGTYIYNLVIHSVQPGDAGEYTCAEDEGVGEKYSVQLVVLDGDPICRSNTKLDEVIGQNTCNIEPDKLEIECIVTYHGNIPPQLEWKKVGENSSTALEVSIATSKNQYVSTLKLRGHIALNNSSYVCETKRTTQEPSKCTSQVIQILYALSDNSTVNKTVDDEIHCNANTSQSCNYKWKWFEDNDVTTESSTSVLKARKPGWHRCEAECYLRNKTCNLLVMRALVSGETGASLIIYVVVAVVVTLVGLVVVALIFVFRWIVRRKVSDEAATEDCEETISKLSQRSNKQFEEDHMALLELLKEPLRAIYGLAVLGQEVFISRLQHPAIEVYDSTTFSFTRRMPVDGMTDPEHIVSCSVNNCLYAFEWHYSQNQSFKILRIDPTNGNMIKLWNTYEGGGRLSIASDTNVILNINYKAKLHEYTADGTLIRKIDLGSGTGIIHAWHALKLNNGRFVVCHGDYEDPLSRVCLLSTKATTTTVGRTDKVEILKVFGGKQGDPNNILIGPMYLSVDRKGSILVLDGANKRAVLLTSNFDKPRILVSEVDGLETWWRTCFDESTGHWFVADYHHVMMCWVKDGRVMQRLIHTDRPDSH